MEINIEVNDNLELGYEEDMAKCLLNEVIVNGGVDYDVAINRVADMFPKNDYGKLMDILDCYSYYPDLLVWANKVKGNQALESSDIEVIMDKGRQEYNRHILNKILAGVVNNDY